MTESNAYAEAGVYIEAADTAVELMKGWIEKARRPEVIGGLGGFAGLFDASALTRYTRPLLATSTDGVGTKVAIAQAMDIHDTIGFDLVGMVVDDLVVCGAEPLFMTDYIASGRVVPERIAAIVKGIAEGCVAGRLRAGRRRDRRAPRAARPRRVRRRRRDHRRGRGRQAARPRPGPPRRRGASRWRPSGLHSNGYSLVRHVLLAKAGLSLDRTSTSSAAPSARSCWSRPGSTPRPAWRSPTGPAPTRCPTSPAAVWPPTSRGCCPVELRGDARPLHLDPAADLRPGPPRRRRTPARPRGDPQLRRRHGRADRSRGRRRGDRGARRARHPRLGRRRGRRRDRPRRAPSSWSVSTPAGDDSARFTSGIAGTDVREQPGNR